MTIRWKRPPFHATTAESPPRPPGATELRATLSLAWPLILANLTMAADPGDRRAADGRLGATPLAAAALALNLTFAFKPDLPRAGHRLVADDGDRARPALKPCATCAAPSASRLWLIATVTAAGTGCCCGTPSRSSRLRPGPGARAQGQTFLRGYMWSMLPFLLFQAMRNFVAALERPGWVLASASPGSCSTRCSAGR
jgi:MATE family multidrug resistance protein